MGRPAPNAPNQAKGKVMSMAKGKAQAILSRAKFAMISFITSLGLKLNLSASPSGSASASMPSSMPSTKSLFARGKAALPGFRHWAASLFRVGGMGAFSKEMHTQADLRASAQGKATPRAPDGSTATGTASASRVFLDEGMATTYSDDLRWYGTELGAAEVEEELDTAVWFYGGVGG